VLCGFVNGALISGLRVVPFIITLGTTSIFLGLGNWLSEDVTVRPHVDYQVPDLLEELLSNREGFQFARLPLGAWITLIAAILLAVMLKYTVFGRYIFAIGSNEQTARLCGINVGWSKVAVYSLAGLFVGIAGVLQFSRLASGSPTSGEVLTLPTIAAVVIGGGSLSGGRGSVLGTLAGAAIMAVILSSGTHFGLSKWMQQVFLGVVIISAAAVDQQRVRGLFNGMTEAIAKVFHGR
jgi:ribose transport system permease protein